LKLLFGEGVILITIAVMGYILRAFIAGGLIRYLVPDPAGYEDPTGRGITG